MAVRALVALHADALDRQEHGEGLPDLVVEAEVLDRLDEDLVDLLQHAQRVALRDVAEDAHAHAGAREGVALDEGLGHAQQAADRAHLFSLCFFCWFGGGRG